MKTPERSPMWVLFVFLTLPAVAQAGMPTITLTDVARMRLQSISFFLAVFLVAAFLIKVLWNFLGKDWVIFPRLSFGRALLVVALWGLLFILVLTMISGARELMTPGAWQRQGSTYRLARPAGCRDRRARPAPPPATGTPPRRSLGLRSCPRWPPPGRPIQPGHPVPALATPRYRQHALLLPRRQIPSLTANPARLPEIYGAEQGPLFQRRNPQDGWGGIGERAGVQAMKRWGILLGIIGILVLRGVFVPALLFPVEFTRCGRPLVGHLSCTAFFPR